MDFPSKSKIKSGVSKEEIINTLESFQTAAVAPSGTENKENGNNSCEGRGPKSEITDPNGSWDFLEPSDFSSPPASLSHSYSLEWDKLFCRPDKMIQGLQEKALRGDLRSSRFRSVVWKIFLEVLPQQLDKWVEKTRESRAKFEELKNKLIVNPRKAVDSVNLRVHNPLSQDEESPWNKFFQDNELRLTIKQDVIRTFPEVEFFRCSDLGDMMIDILFCYSRENACLSYKQGMHELLAPLIFVLHCDHQAFLHACEIESVLDIMKEVMDPAYLEHDAYAMFCQVMETVEPWYISREPYRKNGSFRSLEIINATPFARSQDLNPSSAIVTKLTRIQDYVLKKLDPELHQHLERLEIVPQIYGIRWLRLLFGREFPMQDILMLWDAIFADGIGFDLVDYIFVSMLLYIRDSLISSDYTSCLTILMKYPSVPDVHYFVVKALYIREPSQYARPPNYSHQGSIGVMSSSDSISNYDNLNTITAQTSSSSNKKTTARETKHPLGSTVSLSQVEESMMHHGPSTSSLARLETSVARSAQSSPGVHHSGHIFPLTPEDSVGLEGPCQGKLSTLPGKPSKKKLKKLTATEREYQDQVIRLQGQLNDKETMCRYCASKMDAHIDNLQHDLSTRDLDIGDEMMVSLAGLKLVRDILNGTLKFNQTLGEDTEEFTINDCYYEIESSANTCNSKGSELRSPDSDILMGASSSSVPQSRRGSSRTDFYVTSEDISPEVTCAGIVATADMKNSRSSANIDYDYSHRDPLDIRSEVEPKLDRSRGGDKFDRKGSLEAPNHDLDKLPTQKSPSKPLSTVSDEPNFTHLTSKIRNMFKISQKQSSSSNRKSSDPSMPSSSNNNRVVEDYSTAYNAKPSNALERSDILRHGEDRRLMGMSVAATTDYQKDNQQPRRRSQSTVDSVHEPLFHQSEDLWPHSHQSRQNRRGSKGSIGSSGSASDFVFVGDNSGEKAGGIRERSKSQPVNPLYSLKYDEGLDC